MTASRPSPRKPPVYPQVRRGADLPSPWLGVLMLLLLAVVVAGVGAGGLYLWLMAAPPEVRVPDVTGINLRAAEQMLSRRGLISQVAAHRYDAKAPADYVLRATPPPGRTVRQGRVVELVVSDGPPWALMPDVQEMELAQARDALAKADLVLARIVRRYSDTVPAGWVMEQTPAAGGRVPRRDRVTLAVSAGPKEPPQPVASPAEPKQAEVQVTLPEGDRESMVRIEVEDERGTTIAYNQSQPPGATVTQIVTGYGDAIARVYVDDTLIEEKRF